MTVFRLHQNGATSVERLRQERDILKKVVAIFSHPQP
jgi:hypothetical protein